MAENSSSTIKSPVIFLDIDGVLNNVASLAEGVHLLPEKALLVRDICAATGAVVVISSAWRSIYEPEVLRSILYRVGLRIGRGKWGGYVREHRDLRRNHEIADYVTAHEVERYVILDDEDWEWYPDQLPHFVKTPIQSGITRQHVTDAIAILRGIQPQSEPTSNFTAAELMQQTIGGA